MSVLVRYAPSDEDEVFDILNLLDERLKHSNSGVVLVWGRRAFPCPPPLNVPTPASPPPPPPLAPQAAARLFLHLTRDMPDLADDIYERLKVQRVELPGTRWRRAAMTLQR